MAITPYLLYDDVGGALKFFDMFNSGGQPSTWDRREVDLNVYSDNVEDLYRRLKDRVDVEAGPHDTFYGMREFIIRDLNRFWITFGQASVFEVLMTGVREDDTDVVRFALESGGIPPETLTAALAVASAGNSTSGATFRPIAFDNFGTVTFNVEAGKTMGCALKHGESTMQLKRAEETQLP